MTLDIDRLQDLDVFDRHGDKIGAVGQIYVDDNTGEPTFVTVKTGLFGTKETFVPVRDAEQVNDGLRVPFDKAFVKDAPNIDSDGHLSESEQDNLYTYYGIGNEDLDPHQGRSNYPGEEGLRGSPGVGTAGYGDARQEAYDRGERSGDARYTQNFGRDEVSRDNLRDDQRVYADDDLGRDDLARDGLIDENRGRRDDIDAARHERSDSGGMGDAGAAGVAGAAGAAAAARQRADDRDVDVDRRDDVNRVDLTDRDDRDFDRDRDDRDGAGLTHDDRDRPDERDRDRDERGAGRGMRLRKYKVTEMKTVQVPVEREVVELEDDSRGDRGTREGVREGDVRDTLERDRDQELRRD
ncbi:MAG: PRC-barrel domain-containing protein [Dermatophilus congolensis]|nr:PRC-barrel domain-containing protein [Dermatophilus congolensis]